MRPAWFITAGMVASVVGVASLVGQAGPYVPPGFPTCPSPVPIVSALEHEACPAADARQLVANGGFEIATTGSAPAYIQPLGPGATELAGWEVVEGSVDWIGPARWRAAEGMACLDIDAPGAIRQTVATRAGQTYVLEFDLAGNVETPPSAKLLAVELSGVRRVIAFDSTGHTPTQMGWQRQRIVFQAVEDGTVLAFLNASTEPTASGVAVDNVSVLPVEAETGAGPAIGRYSLATTGERLVLLDTATGRTWVLEEGESGPVWRPLEGATSLATPADPADAAGPYDDIRTER
jgi:choice-of-anchor C domain-containing protein